MVAWSGLLRSAGQIFLRRNGTSKIVPLKNDCRLMSEHRIMQIQPPRWHWHKTKDLFHFYLCLTGIPMVITITLINIFIGPATLTPIPEDYVPKHWEYYRHPISRFLARYFFESPQMEYERNLHYIWNEQEVIKCRRLEKKVKELMSERRDYQAYYYLPFDNARYIRRQAQYEKDENTLFSGGDDL